METQVVVRVIKWMVIGIQGSTEEVQRIKVQSWEYVVDRSAVEIQCRKYSTEKYNV